MPKLKPPPTVLCACGKPAERGWRGRDICWACWNWYKLDGPAARYWIDKLMGLYENMDMYDLMQFMPRVFQDAQPGYHEDNDSAIWLRLTRTFMERVAGLMADHGEPVDCPWPPRHDEDEGE